jgi:predicted small lipoprotein YifL
MTMQHNDRLKTPFGWKAVSLAALVCTFSLGLAACEKKGPLEQAGEEVDEAVDTMKHGGKESTATKVDDAADEVREGAGDAADKLKKD